MTPQRPTPASPGKIAHTLAALRSEPHGISIYALARKLKRPYRRVFENVRRLQREGAVRIEPAIARGRRVSLVFAGGPPVRDRIAFPEHLTDLERPLLAAFAARVSAASPRIRAIVLFGSRARGRSTPESDLDVAVLVDGRRDPRLEDRVVAIAADEQWRAPFDGTLRLNPLVVFSAAPAGAIRRTLEREGSVLWIRHA